MVSLLIVYPWLIEDYDRLHYAPKEVQLRHFNPLLILSKTFRLPLFLHSRSSEAHIDFVKILREAGWDDSWPGGVVHSFTGTIDEAKELVCALKGHLMGMTDERWIWDYISESMAVRSRPRKTLRWSKQFLWTNFCSKPVS